MMRSVRFFIRLLKSLIYKLLTFKNFKNLCRIHFWFWSNLNHLNYLGFAIALRNLNKQSPVIFETGTSAHGVDSSRLWDRAAVALRGKFISVDINSAPKRALTCQLSGRSELFIGDSVDFIQNRLPGIVSTIDLCYLDSWDVDWSQPSMSERHGLSEFLSVHRLLSVNSILMIDDTPIRLDLIPVEFQGKAREYQLKTGRIPGKGSLILLHDFFKCYEVILHEYNLVAVKKVA